MYSDIGMGIKHKDFQKQPLKNIEKALFIYHYTTRTKKQTKTKALVLFVLWKIFTKAHTSDPGHFEISKTNDSHKISKTHH
jgi:hypothetical protein